MSDQQARDGISHPAVAAVYDATLPLSERFLGPHREYLVADLSGRVLDLGAGSGATFSHVDEREGSLEYHALEPDPHMRRRAIERARDLDLSVTFSDGRAESMPYADDAFDVVIAAVVFCTIADPDAALDEVARVLRPGGEFRFLEHVRADGWRGSAQDVITPVWKRAAGGCHLNRETVERLVGHDAFDVLEVERTGVRTFPAAPIVRGRLRRGGDDVFEG